jgi:hypothetical protein
MLVYQWSEEANTFSRGSWLTETFDAGSHHAQQIQPEPGASNRALSATASWLALLRAWLYQAISSTQNSLTAATNWRFDPSPKKARAGAQTAENTARYGRQQDDPCQDAWERPSLLVALLHRKMGPDDERARPKMSVQWRAQTAWE